MLLVAAVAAGLWWYGSSYYLVPLAVRPDHALHHTLSSTGFLGHPLGWAGLAMLLLLLAYSLRKRLSWLQPLGALRHWLSLHIFLGLMGPLLITFHSGFKIGGLVSIAYWSMIVTMLSGIFGRYIYVQIPSSAIDGRQSLAALMEESRQLSERLQGFLGAQATQVLGVADAAWDRNVRGWRATFGLFVDDLGRPLQRWRLMRQLRADTSLSRRDIREIVSLAQRRRLLERRTAAAESMERVMHYWHVLHRPLVYITFLIAAVHIGVAWWLGYRGW